MKKKKKTTYINFVEKINETKNVLTPPKTISPFHLFSKGVRIVCFNKRKCKKWLISFTAVFFIVLIILITLTFIYQRIHYDRFFSNIKLANINLSNKTLNEVRQEIATKADQLSQEGLIIRYQDREITVTASSIGIDPESSVDLFYFDSEDILKDLFSIGREKDGFTNLKEQFLAFVFSPNYPLPYYLDEKKVKAILQDNFSEFEIEAHDAEIVLDDNKIKINHEEIGKVFNYNEIIQQIKQDLAYLNAQPVNLSLRTDYPKIYKEQIETVKPQIENIINLAPIALTVPEKIKVEQREWIIDKDKLVSFLTVKKSLPTIEWYIFNNKGFFDNLSIGFKKEEIEKYMQEEIIEFINEEPVDAKFVIKGEKVKEFQPSKKGQKLDIQETLAKMEYFILDENKQMTLKEQKPLTIKLIIKEVESKISNEDVNNLGIKEIIGVGKSNFAGSPKNRRHNIKIGAYNALHGTLIKPEQEFSLNKAIGEVSEATGYLPELVIKGNRTIPEYGGGLCQIGTTMFRVALASGLPITQRRHHAFRVIYYEPAGTDATIYNPWPDFKFINDTENHILIQSRIESDNLYFEFWGTKDDRKITQTKPKIYNITKPPPTKIIETEELEPGEKKCTEHAVDGADTHFDYTVEYPDGIIKEETFFSHYRPWQEVCLLGVEATSTPEAVDVEENNN